MTGKQDSADSDRDYQSYLLRLWRSTCDGQTIWRASLESPHSGKLTGFASLEALFDHLRAGTGRTKKGGER